MYKMIEKNGLLYATVDIEHNGKTIIVDDVIIDTGAYHSIILTDYLEELDVGFSENDELVKSSGYGGVQMTSVRKMMDRMRMGNIELNNFKIDFGDIDPYERVNGLIGLDFLKGAGVIIDIVDSTISRK